MAAQAGPKDGRIVNGSGSISHSGTHTDIHQNSDFLSTRWGSFNIGANESVQAHQPGASSRLLIRVDGGGATNIAGNYTSNGITILENRNGVQFSQGAIVNVGGLLATSSRIRGLGGNNWRLNGIGGAVVNHGTIAAGAGGAILAAVKVQNTGDITAKGGDVALGAGSSFTVDFAGSMVGFEVTKAASGASITNSGKIEAQGGVVALSAQEAQEVRTNVVSVGGVVKATRMERRGGVVYLSGGDEGVAEVSGDVQASKKVQTTGEYVVVKEGAVLTAPKILVGGDFQGRGDVQTAKRTLVEAGALLDAGQEGRVIVWSDEITWFNGNINVPGGFAEVSGKRNLATVNLPGINVGASGTLLLDPWIIDIGTIGTTTLPADGIQFDDGPSVDGTPPITIRATDVGNFVGNLELQARRAIRINADITSTTLTSLTLRAQDADNGGADNTQNGGDGGDSNNIRFNGTGRIIDLGEASFTVISGVINILGTSTVQITARGGVTFRYNRDEYTSVADTVTTNIVAGALTTTADTTVTYAFGLAGVADDISETAINCAGQTDICSITRAADLADRDVEISSGSLTARTSLTVDIGTGALSFAGTGLITVSAPTVSIAAGSLNIGARNLIIEATGGSLTLGTNITTTGDITLDGMGGIVLGADIALRGGNIELTGAIAGTEGTSRGLEIITNGMGDITLNSDINLQGGRLDLRTSPGVGNIITMGSPTIMVGALSLRDGDATDGTGYIAGLFSADSVATGEVIIRVAQNADAITIQPWMVAVAQNASSFILRQTNGATITTLTLPASFDLSVSGNIELNAGAIALSGSGTTILSGAVVTLTGGITGAGALDLTATGRLTLNSGIAIDGDLAIIAGERINVVARNTFTAGGEFTINFTDLAVAGDEVAAFTAGTTETRGNLIGDTPTITFGDSAPETPVLDCVIDGEACMLTTVNDENLITDDADLASDVSIMISIGGGTLTFGGSAAITINAPTVFITAGTINTAGRALTITTTTGALTLNTNINVGTADTAVLTLISGTGAIMSDHTPEAPNTLTASTVNLTQASEFANDQPFAFAADAVSFVRNGGRQTVRPWMIVQGRDLSIRAVFGNININDNVQIGTGDLILSSTNGITFGGPRTLMGGEITLTGAINPGIRDLTIMATGRLTLNSLIDVVTGTLAITAGELIDIPNNITITAGIFTIVFTDPNIQLPLANGFVGTTLDNLNLGGATTIMPTFVVDCLDSAGACMLTTENDDDLMTDDADLVSDTSITISIGAGTLTFGGGSAAITIDAPTVSITAGNIDIEGRALTITTSDGGALTLNTDITADEGSMGNVEIFANGGGTLTIGGDINARGGALTLSSAGITLNSNVTLTGGAITLTGAINDDNALNIDASGVLTLNSNIDTGAGNLTLEGSTIVLVGAIELDGGAITLDGAITETGNDALTVTATGALTLNDNIDIGTGALSLTGTIIVLDGTTTLRGGAITLTGRIGGTNALTVTASGQLTLNDNIIVTGAGNDLTLSGTSIVLGPGRNVELNGAAIELMGALTSSNNLIIIASGDITLNSNIATGAGNLTLSGDTIVLGSAAVTSLTGAAVKLTGAISRVSGNANLTVRATGVLTLNDNININAGDLALTAGTGVIMNGGIARMLTAGTVSLTQTTGAFGDNLFTIAASVTSLTLTVTGSGSSTNQTVHDWMVAVAERNRTLSITTPGVLTIGRDIPAGTGNLTLSGSALTLSGGARTLTGGLVTLTGTISGGALAVDASGELRLNSNINTGAGNLTLDSDTGIVLGSALTALDGGAITLTGAITRASGNANLDIDAGGRLTLNNDIDLGSTGTTLAITANALITVSRSITVTAETFTIVFTDPAVQDTDTGFGGTFGNLAPIIVPTFQPPLAAECIIAACMLGTIGEDLLVAATLTAADSITINIGSANTLTFAGGATDPIMITSDVVTITAGDINIGTRPLTITASGGALTLNTSITTTGALILSGGTIMLGGPTTLGGAAITLTGVISGGALTVMASGVLTLNSDINIGTDALSLTAGTGGTGNIVGVGTLTLTAGTVSLTQAGVFPSTAPFTFAANTLNLEVTAATTADDNRQTVYGWMTSDNRALSLTSNRAILIGLASDNTTVSTGTGDLTLDGGEGIVLGFSSATLTGGNVELTGEIDKSGSDTIVIIRAMANLTLNSNIRLRTDTSLTLAAGMGGAGDIIVTGTRTFNATRVTLGQRMAFTGPTAPFTIFATSLTLMTAANQTVYDWMAGRALDLTSEGVITINGNINTGGNALTLTGRSGISLTATAILTGGAIMLDGAITGTNDFTVNAAGALTLNSDITIGGAALSLSAGAGAIMNGSTARALTAGTVSLNQAAAFDPTAPFTFGSATSLTLTTAAPQTVHGWMTSVADRALNLTTTGAITVNENIDTGTRALTLSAGTSIFLRGVGGARTLEGSAVTLTGVLDSRVSGDGAAANNIIITAGNGNITITGSIIASGNDGVGFGNPGGAGGALTLTANSGNIMITGNFTSIGGVGGFVPSVGGVSGAGGAGGAVTLMAGNIMIGNINAGGGGVSSQRSQLANGGNGGSGGAVMITGTGTVQIGEIRANGVNGQGTTNDNNGGTGGAGGVITLQGASVSVSLINSVRGRGGVNQGEGSNGSGGVAGSVMITATDGNLTLGGNVNVDSGTITLEARGATAAILNDGTQRTLTASTVSLRQVATFAPGALFTFTTPTLNLTTAANQIVHGWMFAVNNRNLSLTSSGAITINADITLGSGNLTLNGTNGITVTGSHTLSGGTINLTGAITSGSDLTVTATGALTLNSNITARNLTLTAGTGEIMNGGDMRQLNAGTVSLTQASVFDLSPRFTFASGVNSLVLDAGSAQQAVHAWMVFGGRSLDLTTTGAITIGRDIALGAGNLTLDGGTLAFTGTGQRILSGENITFTGNATNAGALTVNANGQLTLNSNITTTGANDLRIVGAGISVAAGITLASGNNLTLGGTMTTTAGTGGNGNLTLIAAGTLNLNADLTLGTGTATLSAGSATGLAGTSLITAMAINITFGDTAIRVASDVVAIMDGSITFSTPPTYQFEALGCVTPVAEACVIGGTAQLLVEPDLASNISITIETTNVSGSSVRFDGTGTITLTSPLVTIIAETINLEGRNLVIVDAGGGTLALAGNVSGAAAITARNGGGTAFGFINIVGARTIAGDAITLTATLIRTVDRGGSGSGIITDADHDLTIIATGGLTIATDISTGTGTTLTLTAGPGDITGTGTPMLTADTVSFTQDGTFGDTALFTFAASVGALELETAAGQRVESWMFAVMDRDLSVTSPGRLLILGDINIRAGDLTLSGMRIELDQNTNAITLTGGAVSLTGNVDGSLNTIDFTIMAGGILTLNNNINGTGDIMLTGTSIALRDGARTLNGGAVTLTGAVSATNTPLTITATGDITINNNINLGTGALILTATGANIVDVDGVVPVLTASTVSLTQAGTFADGLFTVASATSLTLDAGSAAQTVHAWMVDGTNNRALSLTTTGAIMIGRDIATGTSNLTLVGGSLMLTGAATLSGADVALTGAATGTANLTITASGTLTLNSNITLTGSGLTLTLSGAGAIGNGGSPTALAASTVSLAQAATFASGALFTFTADTLNLTTAAPQMVHGWMTSGDRSLNLTSTGGEITTGNIDTGMGDLTLNGMGGIVGNGFTTTLAGRNVVLTGGFRGARLEPTLRITAMGDITIDGNIMFDISTSTGLILTADANGTGNITIVGTSRLAARDITLTQAGAFASPPVAFTIVTNNLNLVTGAAQTVYPWMVASGRNLSLTSNGGSITVGTAITASRNITLTATTININADIGTSSTPIAGLLTLDGDTLAFSGPRILSSANISLTGAATNAADLTITTTGTLTIAASIAITGGDLMLTGGTGGIVIGTATGRSTLDWSGDVVTLVGDVTTASNVGAANLTDLTITAQGVLTVAGIDLSNSDDTAHGALVLIAGAGTQDADLAFSGGPTLNAASVELRQDTDFNATRPVDIEINGTDPGLTDNPDTVVISGATPVPWARVLVTDGPLTITDGEAGEAGVPGDSDGVADNGIVLDTARLAYTGLITINAGAMNITFAAGLGNISWEAPNITITAGSIVLGGRALTITTDGGTLTLNVESIMATGANNLMFTGTTINLNVTNITSAGNLSLTGETIRIGRASSDAVDTTTTLTGAAITLTAVNGIEVGRFNGQGDFRSNNDVANFTVTASGALTIAADITVADGTRTGGNIALTGGSIDFDTAARTITGRAIRLTGDVTATDGLTVNAARNLDLNGNITTGTSALSLMSAIRAIRIAGGANATRTLDGGNITLTAANGVVATATTDALNLAVTADGVLTIAAAITTEGVLTLEGTGAIVTTGRPRLTASTVNLTQEAAFAPTGPFRLTAGSLVLTTDAAQDVHNWMVGSNRNLTVESLARVRVGTAIGASVPSRNLGDGTLTLTSTGADIRIQENISTTGDIILSGALSGTGATGIDFDNRGAKTLSGADITLTGVVVSNRDLTLTASGTLTLNNNITTTASNLVLIGGTGGISGSANGLTITADGTLTINSDRIATGTNDLSLTGATIRLGLASGGGDPVGTTTLTGSAITLTATAAEGVITVGRFNRSGGFRPTTAPALMVTATGVLTIDANITSIANITLAGGTGGIVTGGTTGLSAFTWRGSDITLTGAVTTASTVGTDNFTNLTLSAGGNLVVGAIDLANNAGSTADARGGLILRAGDGSGTGTITVTGGSATAINAGSIELEQDEEVFAAAEPADFRINGTDVGTTSLRSMVIVLYRGEAEQGNVTWGTVTGVDAIELGTSDAPLTTPITLFNGILRSRVSITINAGTGAVTFDPQAADITLEAPVITITAGSIDTSDRTLTITTDGGTLTLNSDIDTGTGNLTLTSGTIQITRGATAAVERSLSGTNITLTAVDGIQIGRFNNSGAFRTNNDVANFTVNASGVLTIAADITVDSAATSGGNITLTGGDIAFGAVERTISGVDIALTGAAAGTANLTLNASGTLMLNNNIALTGADLTLALSGAGAIARGATAPVLTASTVSLRQVDVFALTALFTFGTATDTSSLVLITTSATDDTDMVVDQSVHDWMITPNRSLTVMSPSRVAVAADIVLGTGSLTLDSATGIGIDTSGGARTLSGVGITLVGAVSSTGANNIIINASGTLRLNGNIDTGTNDLSLTGATIQIGRRAPDRLIELTGAAITLTSSSGIQLGRGFDEEGAFQIDRRVANLAVRASGALTIAANITVPSTAGSGGNIELTGNSIVTTGERTITGRAIALSGAATGTANLTLNASGTLTLNDNIVLTGSGLTLALSGAGTIVNGGTTADDTTLTASTVSLEQDAAFDAMPFAFGSVTDTASLVLITAAEQDVRDWMILANRNLTVESSDRVRVRADIVASGGGARDLGTGDLTLTSGGRTLRISADISTGGDITLSGGTGGINLNGTDTLTGVAITLNGAARSNSALTTITASGILTLNGDINTGTNALTLIGATISIAGDDSDTTHTLSGGAITLTGVATGTANLTINARGILTINNDITLTGANLTLASSSSDADVAAIVGGAVTPVLTASTVSLEQVAAFDAVLFTFGTATGSLVFITDAAQDVQDWMINDGIDLTVRSDRPVNVLAAIVASGDGARDIGAGNITLTSGRRVGIGADITTTGDITLTGVATSTQPAIRFEDGAREVIGTNIRLTGSAGIFTGGGSVTLTANATSGTLTLTDDIDTGMNDLSLTGATIQIGRRGSDRLIELTGAAITLTSASGIDIGRFSGSSGAFEVNRRVANLTVTATGVLTIAGSITVADEATEGDIALTGGSIDFGDAARTITGRAIRLRGAATGTADLTLTARGLLRINSTIALTGGDLTLSGATEINLNGGVDVGQIKTLSGAIITLTGAARSNRALTLDASGTLTINNDITLGSGLTLALSGAGAIVATGRPRLTASTVSLTQIDAFAIDAEGRGPFRLRASSLELTTGAAQDVQDWMISSSRNLTLTSAGQVRVGADIGADVSGRNLGTRSLTLESTGADIRIEANISTAGNITLDGDAGTGIDLSGGARTISGVAITLTGDATSDADVSLTTTDALTLDDGITLTGTGILNLRSREGDITGTGTLLAPTVRLRQVGVFGDVSPFNFSSTPSLELITAADQDVLSWMIVANRNLTVRSSARVRVTDAIVASGGGARDLGTGDITLESTRGVVRISADITTGGDITLDASTVVNLNSTDTSTDPVTLTGAIITLIGNAQSDRALTLDASGTLRLSHEIRVTGDTSDLSLTGPTIQIGRRGSDTGILLRGDNDITLTSGSGIDIGRFDGDGVFQVDRRVANFTVNAGGTSTIEADITVADTATSGGGIEIRSRSNDEMTTPIDFGDDAARTITGRAIRLRGDATGTADLTLDSSGTLRIDNDINIDTNALTLISGVGAIIVGTERSMLTASTVSLEQVAAFARRPFDFDFGSTGGGSLELTTTVNQDVLNWMIADGRDLTVESSARVRVTDAIVAIGDGARDIGDGNLTLTSTEGVVRISADITTTGNIILSAVTSGDDGGGINLNGGARILNGRAITLTGAARGNGALTLNATGGALTINDNIDIGIDVDRILTLTATGGFIFGSSVDLRAGDYVFPTAATCTADSTGPRCTR